MPMLVALIIILIPGGALSAAVAIVIARTADGFVDNP